MTADERIKKLLNRFGQTISDLPKPNNLIPPYSKEEQSEGTRGLVKWYDLKDGLSVEEFVPMAFGYMCHQNDVIDRLCDALEKKNENKKRIPNETGIVKTSYPNAIGKYGEIEDRIKALHSSEKRLSKCLVCNTPFERDDVVYLAICKRGKNKLLCGNCAARI